ncbi:hypothetical protein SOVF_076070 [Spinacia oleracea]|uniref:Uncharacterized protein isoform X2 n=1 Tax=Spinacia oleracea TaxID=3562 RepID=A0A9R0IY06_SPIOL|nr:uncharacterized protein LOC110795596 isoform X2 [Spinacia oleracea]KNA17865.1 hypothetical protein SOVF_076070 [Spinacia oleracea]
MANLRSDATTSRRITRAFLDFLDSVEPAPGVDLEGLEVAKDCLTEVFRLHLLPESERPEPNLLLNIFSSSEEARPGSSAQNNASGDFSGTSRNQGDGEDRESSDIGASNRDELSTQLLDALEKMHFFTTPDGDDDHLLRVNAVTVCQSALFDMEDSGCEMNRKNLADTLKTQGNKDVQSSNYEDAIIRYTSAIALCENAVYYCNRAAAYTQMRKYDEAIKDCLKSIEIDPNYSKAYSRLGLAYYAQGKYSDAINKGYKRALELDPNSNAVKENIRVAEQKLNEEQEQTRRNQDHPTGSSGNQAAPPPSFSSVSFDAGTIPANLPANFASMFSNIAGNASQNQTRQGEANHETRSPFGSSTFDSNAIPSEMASMFMNMAGSAFQGQQQDSQSNHENGVPNFASMFMNMAGQGQPQGAHTVVDDDDGTETRTGQRSFSFNFDIDGNGRPTSR